MTTTETETTNQEWQPALAPLLAMLGAKLEPSMISLTLNSACENRGLR